MLQQTQVATVIPYFNRFMERFPTLETLAAANTDEILTLWTGLGYYARGRNLHKCAIQLRDEFGSAFPRDVETLSSLPGIGRSTAAAVLAQSFDERHAILDGNVKRVLARVHCVEGWPGQSSVLKHLWNLSEHHTPASSAADYTQAIMDLGATLCARKPRCGECPVATYCGAHANGTTDRYPGKKPKKVLPEKQAYFLIAQDRRKRVYLERRPPSGIWGGLWCPPEFPDRNEATDWLSSRFDLISDTVSEGKALSHTFSHFRLQMIPLLAEITKQADGVHDAENSHWLNNQEWPGGTATPIEKLIRQITDTSA